MYNLIINLDEAKTVYENYKQDQDSDNPSPVLGGGVKMLRELNELINEDIDSWLHIAWNLDDLIAKFMESQIVDNYGISDLLYVLLTDYIPPSTYIDVSIIDNHGNLCIVIED